MAGSDILLQGLKGGGAGSASSPYANEFSTATTTVSTTVNLLEGTNNGTNKVVLKPGNSLSGDLTFTFPNAQGSNGQALKTNASGVLSWDTPVSSAAGWYFLQEYTASGATSLQITNNLTSSYVAYAFVYQPTAAASDVSLTRVRVSTDGGSTWLSTNEYRYHFQTGVAGTYAATVSTTGTYMPCLGVSNATNPSGGIMYLFNPASTTLEKTMLWKTAYLTTAAISMGSGSITTTSAINAIQFDRNLGGTFSATVKLYGLKAG